ncbi:MAG: chaperone modulator CbpM [Granulosicoccus sp.]
MNSHDRHNAIDIQGEDQSYSLSELQEICRLEQHRIIELIEYEVIVAESEDSNRFSYVQLNRLKTACRLQRDLEINTPGVALALDLLDTIEQLKNDIGLLRRIHDS